MQSILRQSILSVFSAVSKHSPNAIAIAFRDINLSYCELDNLSDVLACSLQTVGVKEGSIVGLMMPRSPNAIVSLLAILKAGAAYMPLDEAYPADRIQFMLSDSDCGVIVIDRNCQKKDLFIGRTAVNIDHSSSRTVRPRPPNIDGQHLAYLMYTSGSTGTPKGVEIPHTAILRLVCGSNFARLDSNVRFLHAAPLGFDASTLEIWGPLLNGGKCIIHDEVIPSGTGLLKTIEKHGATSAWLTSALFNAVIDDDPSNLAGLQQLFIGGEALSVPHVRRALAALPGCEIINGYGPTETTTFAATYSIPRNIDSDIGSIPIGKPISETQLYVLNDALNEVANGEVGELYIGGLGLALGYHKREELTRERFIPNPFGNSGAKLYRTGDLVRRNAEGNIEFVGRTDDQVKIRGYRIETGEIESAILQHQSVANCAVVAREIAPGDKRLFAYIVLRGTSTDLSPLRAYLTTKLPEFMQPASFVLLAALPITANGKLDRKNLPSPSNERPELSQDFVAPRTEREKSVSAIFGKVLGIEPIGVNDNFFDLGGNSLLALRAIARISSALDTELTTNDFFQNPTPAALAQHRISAIGTIRTNQRSNDSTRKIAHEPIAIIGMAGRFPGADDINSFWKNVCDGVESIKFFNEGELDPSISHATRNGANYVRARGILSDADLFDASFFGISPKEAELMDPQHRKFLEICWECLESSGYVPDGCHFPVGVFAGMYNATYFQRHVVHHPDLVEKLGEFQVMLANEKDYIATRVAHRLNLTGPAISIHTACSTSLVAICQAVESLRNGSCDMAIAGGVSINCPPNAGYLYQEGSMLSPDGHTRSFDSGAQGTVFSDGAAVVLLKRQGDAIADGDLIYAVIRGVAVNNDGSHKSSFTAPSTDAQATVILKAQRDADVDARDISYVETHGTATPLGDPIEIEALTRAFRASTTESNYCAIGSVKSNFGHLVIAAGATGLIKTALALKHHLIPPTLHFVEPNPKLNLATSPFFVASQLTAWDSPGRTRIAGVSSFGVGGTNAHVIVEEPPAPISREPESGPHLLMLSARSESTLSTSASRIGAFLTANDELDLRDIAHTLRVGRKTFTHRGIVVANTVAEAAAALCNGDTSKFATRSPTNAPTEVAFLFPGQGSQYPGMGRLLYEADGAFCAAFNRCADALDGIVPFDLRKVIFSGTTEDLLPTSVAQPAIFAIEYATAQFWISRGITPSVLVGHSVGEFAAAVCSGVMELEPAIKLVARRGEYMQMQPPGSMLAVRQKASEMTGRLPSDLSLAADNSPLMSVIAGPTASVEKFQAMLESQGIQSKLLQTSHAFHSAMMEPAVEPFRREVATVSLYAPKIPIASTLTGDWLASTEATDPAYWGRHLRESVKFSAALRTTLKRPGVFLLEVGPRNGLATFSRQHFGPKDIRPEIASSLGNNKESDARAIMASVGLLWASGISVDTRPLSKDPHARRIALPTYPFDRKRFWVDAPVISISANSTNDGTGRDSAQTPNPSATTIQQDVSSSENSMPRANPSPANSSNSRRQRLIQQLCAVFEDVAGVELSEADPNSLFMEVGVDSLVLTQVSLQLQKHFGVQITFRQLMESYPSLAQLATHLDSSMPQEAPVSPPAETAEEPSEIRSSNLATPLPLSTATSVPTLNKTYVQQIIEQQMQLMTQQLALLGSNVGFATAPAAEQIRPSAPSSTTADPLSKPAAALPSKDTSSENPVVDDDSGAAHLKYDVKKAFGAIARIHTKVQTELTERQKVRLDVFMRRYIAKTQKSKDYTSQHRPHLADPRVVNGFRPQLKEIIYQIVIERSKGSKVWDIDGNEYIDALNGFGMNLFGWQPDFVLNAIRAQLESGFEIGPQHPLAGIVAKQICDMTGFDRAGFCNTGSEAVMGALRIARTVTGRTKIAMFTGAYHGIFDEVIVRGTKKLRAVPAAPGIMPNTSENVLVLDYGTPESLEILRSQSKELAAILIEPVQSRRPDFQPVQFLKELRQITRDSGTLFIFDEVVTGFRSHPRGAQSALGIDADLASYGKVVGGGFPIGVIAGRREFMDALDGGAWQFGDESIPTVGVTYFAGTFVRHPLALAAAHAVLNHLDAVGPSLQTRLNERTTELVRAMNRFCEDVGAPIAIRNFSSVWKLTFVEDHPMQDLLFAMMRNRGIHILDNFPCFFTTSHTDADIAAILNAFKESVTELQESNFLPRQKTTDKPSLNASAPPVAGARLGRDADGRPAWFVAQDDDPTKFRKVN